MPLPLVTAVTGLVKGVVGAAGDAFESHANNKTERKKFEKELAETLMNNITKLLEQVIAIIQAEATGNWLQRSWRPLTMLTFLFLIVYMGFVMPLVMVFAELDLLTPTKASLEAVPERMWGLLQLGIGGYIAGRTIEKGVKTWKNGNGKN